MSPVCHRKYMTNELGLITCKSDHLTKRQYCLAYRKARAVSLSNVQYTSLVALQEGCDQILGTPRYAVLESTSVARDCESYCTQIYTADEMQQSHFKHTLESMSQGNAVQHLRKYTQTSQKELHRPEGEFTLYQAVTKTDLS